MVGVVAQCLHRNREDDFENLPLGVLESHLDEVTSAAYSVSLFTDWSGPAINQVWLKQVALP